MTVARQKRAWRFFAGQRRPLQVVLQHTVQNHFYASYRSCNYIVVCMAQIMHEMKSQSFTCKVITNDQKHGLLTDIHTFGIYTWDSARMTREYRQEPSSKNPLVPVLLLLDDFPLSSLTKPGHWSCSFLSMCQNSKG